MIANQVNNSTCSKTNISKEIKKEKLPSSIVFYSMYSHFKPTVNKKRGHNMILYRIFFQVISCVLQYCTEWESTRKAKYFKQKSLIDGGHIKYKKDINETFNENLIIFTYYKTEIEAVREAFNKKKH